MFTDYYINVIIAYGGSDGSGGSYYALQTFISVGPNGSPISISASYTVAIQLRTSLTGPPVWYSTTNASNVVGSYPTNFHSDHSLTLSDLTGTYKNISIYGSTPVQLNPDPILSGF
ncbi:MAG: hypothetical protein EOP51_18120 [Sphingobacteriales bacterium]|nr:MAG: hypothetical protein EOP51_18120 [Sphingobacteriales bacterium]